jgi:tryptophan 2,3-dioxygenase
VSGFSADFISASIQLNPTGSMTPKAVEQLLTQEARLLARRDSPVIDKEIEEQRQAALEIFYRWQDGLAQFQDIVPFCLVLERKVDLNRALLKWEQEHLTN